MRFRANASDTWHKIKIKALDGMPIGAGIEFYGPKNKIPSGFLICDGSAISRTEYVDLFNVIGTTYGDGDGSTTFNLPNTNGKVGVGIDENDTDFDTIGKTGGEKTHKLTPSEIPALQNQKQVEKLANYGESVQVPSGSAQEHNIMQPYIAIWKLIKANNTTPTMASIVNTTNDSTTDAYSCDFINKALDNKKVLYENTNGTTGNITLNDDASNYSYLMVYWRSTWNSTRQGCAMAPTFANNWSLFEEVVESGSGSSVYKNIAIYSINETSFNLIKSSNYNGQNSNTFYITKIVGYK